MSEQAGGAHAVASARVLAAFNRRDVRRFRDVFLASLRASGNHQKVVAVGYGLRSSEVRMLSRLPNVRIIDRPHNGQMPPVRRLRDFGDVVEELPKQTPVAYWDAADVVFQGRLDPLWELTQSHPSQLLAVREPLGYPHNPAVHAWCTSISNAAKRREAFDLVFPSPFLNSGFGSGTAATMLRYFRTADRIRNSSDVMGTTDWGDQLAMNLYCHREADRWKEVSATWNFCVLDRLHVRVARDGTILCDSQTPICVHGNGQSLPQLAIRP